MAADGLGEDFVAFEPLARPEEPAPGGEAPGKRKTAVPRSVLRMGAPWLRPGEFSSLPSHPTEMLGAEVAAFARYVSPTPEERAARSGAVDRLAAVLRGLLGEVRVVFPSQDARRVVSYASHVPTVAELYVFGSFDSDLFLPGSDIDAVIVLPGAGPTDRPGPRTLHALADALVAAGVSLLEDVQVIAGARIPIVKYRDAATAFEVDVGFNARTGADAARFIRSAMCCEPALRPLVLVLKCFLRMRALNTVYTGGLGSFALLCMVAAFLRSHPALQAGLLNGEDNLGVLLLEFFELFGRAFNYDRVGISLPLARLPAPGDAAFGVRLFCREAHGWPPGPRGLSLSIEDPLDPTNDIAKGTFAMGAVRRAFQHAHAILLAAMREYERAARSGSRAGGGAWPPSILASIVSLDDEMLLHRFYIQARTP